MVGTGTTHMVCCHQMCIFKTSFAYLFWLAKFITKKKKADIQSSLWAAGMKFGMWVVLGTSTTHMIPPGGGPHCIFREYSKPISQELQNFSYFIYYQTIVYSLMINFKKKKKNMSHLKFD